jgi:hypothetical protein
VFHSRGPAAEALAFFRIRRRAQFQNCAMTVILGCGTLRSGSANLFTLALDSIARSISVNAETLLARMASV